MTLEKLNPESLGRPKGWTNGMLGPANGRVLFVAGQIGTDARAANDSDPFVRQFARALEKILMIVAEAGGRAEDVARITIYVTDMGAYRNSLEPLGIAYRKLMGKHFPAMALVEVSSLVDRDAMVEMEAMAVVNHEP